jgi:hypothetical protein
MKELCSARTFDIRLRVVALGDKPREGAVNKEFEPHSAGAAASLDQVK